MVGRVPDLVDVDAGLGSDDVRRVRSGGVGCRDRRRQGAGAVREDRRDLGVDARWGRASRGRDDRGRRAEDVPCERDRVDAEVEERAAAEFERVEAVARVARDLLRVVGEHRADLAERAAADELAHADHVREVARPHRLHREQPAFGRDIANGGRLGAGQRERLLDEDVLAVLEREDRVLGVHRVRGRRRRRCRRRGPTRAPRTSRARAGSRTPPRTGRRIRGTRSDRGDVESRGAQIAREGMGDAARGEDSPAQSSHPPSVPIRDRRRGAWAARSVSRGAGSRDRR